MACPAIRPHFFGACPKKRCRAAKEKRFFYLGGSTIRVSAAASVDGTHLRPTWGGGWWLTGRSSQLDAVGCDVGALCSWERRVGPTSSRGGTQKRVSLGLHPVSLRKSKEMGWNGQDQRGLLPNKTAHTYRAQMRCRLVFALCVCAVTLGGCRCPVLRFDPISLVLAQRNGVEPPKKGAFLPRRLHHSRERYCLGCRYSSSPDLGRGWWLSERLPSPGANGIGYGRFAR